MMACCGTGPRGLTDLGGISGMIGFCIGMFSGGGPTVDGAAALTESLWLVGIAGNRGVTLTVGIKGVTFGWDVCRTLELEFSLPWVFWHDEQSLTCVC